jgi:hypothetical protein
MEEDTIIIRTLLCEGVTVRVFILGPLVSVGDMDYL